MTVRVKVSVDHLRDDITRWIEAEAAEQADTIANAVREAVDAFDFDSAVQRVCETELEKFVREAAGAYFRTLLKSPEAHATVLQTLRKHIGEGE